MKRVLLVNDTRIVGHHGSSSVVDVIFQEFAKRSISVLSDVEHAINIRSLGDHGCQAVVINGEGAMHGGGKHSHLFSRLGEEMHRRRIPVFLINTVFNECTPEILARMRYFTGIYCRETQSARRIELAGVEAKVCPDLTFALELPDGLALRPGNRILVLDTTVASKNRKLLRFCLEHKLDFQPIRSTPRLVNATNINNLLRIVRFNATKHIGKVLPSVYVFGRYANAVASSYAFLQRIVDGTLVVVTPRFHGVCFCMKLGVPFLAISSNTPKIEGMLVDANLSHRMVDMADLNLPVIRSRCAWSPSDEEKRRRYVNDAEGRVARMFDEISAAVR